MLYHALQRADGLWTPFGDVMNAVSPGGTPPEIISLVAVVLINEDLHVCAIDFNGDGRDTSDATQPLAHSSWLSLSISWAPIDATTSDFVWYRGDALTDLTYTAMAGSG